MARPRLLNAPYDAAEPFSDRDALLFLAADACWDSPSAAAGRIRWVRHAWKIRTAFSQASARPEPTSAWEFPPEYPADPALPFALSFVDDRTCRLRIGGRGAPRRPAESPMLVGDVPEATWKASTKGNARVWTGSMAGASVDLEPWRFTLRDAAGRALTRTLHEGDMLGLDACHPLPCALCRDETTRRHSMALTLELAPGEILHGGGESFTRLDKRGQRMVLSTVDAHGAQSDHMYKPVPVILSSRGWGLFVHTGAPVTLDIGRAHDSALTLYAADEELDVFFFVGTPAEILDSYTKLTGRAPLPPLWSFGLWMSRITYKSEAETREVAAKLREQDVPCDVIHLDTGWFEKDWRCDYRFAPSRFEDPEKMIADLADAGFHISLWQLPYFTPTNPLYREAIDNDYVVRAPDGELPTDDAIIDFTNPRAVSWYQGLLEGLLRMGVGAIKADFGEAGPLHGAYHNGQGLREHNLYPLRYNLAVAEVTRRVHDESILWARSAWAGSQRCPVHWGGDAENTDGAMLATLRAGLSLGSCGFSFWSHDAGGFVKRPAPELYLRWLAFACLCSHVRCHGAPPREPWTFDGECPGFTERFREIVRFRYQLMPYILAQATASAASGLPMVRSLAMAFPQDRGAWLVEDAYLFGEDLLVAPLFVANTHERDVYLPAGTWRDFWTGRAVEGGWRHLGEGRIPVVALVREGAAIPMVDAAAHTGAIDWSTLRLRIYAAKDTPAAGRLCTPTAGLADVAPRTTDIPCEWI